MRKRPPYEGACTVYDPPSDCVIVTSVPFSSVTECPKGICTASQSRTSSTRSMLNFLPGHSGTAVEGAQGDGDRDRGGRAHDRARGAGPRRHLPRGAPPPPPSPGRPTGAARAPPPPAPPLLADPPPPPRERPGRRWR